ncbi:MAG: restriction endonuclease [Verrucomicrobia bacterium]|nr:restriction endonuclease [Verrucomicrobiota bacterium]
MSDDDPEVMPWEEAAAGAVDHALESADFDEVQAVVIVPDSTGDHRMAHYCCTTEELQDTLEEIFDEQWYANVPFDGGEALHHGDAAGYLNEIVERDEIQQFFAQFGDEPEGDIIITAPDLLADGTSKVLRVDLESINGELVAYLAAHPEKMRDLHPRNFEELVAELFKSKGYHVHLTPRTRDGGVDIYAVQRSEIGTAMILIECKRHAPAQKVGVEIIRAGVGPHFFHFLATCHPQGRTPNAGGEAPTSLTTGPRDHGTTAQGRGVWREA